MAIDLDIPRNKNRFLRVIKDGLNTNRLTQWEQTFLSDMERYYKERDEIGEYSGKGPWNPTVKQWNTLTDIERKL